MKATKQLAWATITVLCLIACGGKKSTKNGSSLKAEDAKPYLAGKESKYWQLESGHDYNEYLTFGTNNSLSTPAGTTITYSINADKLTMKDYQDFVYNIFEIGDGKLVMGLLGKDTLTYLFYEPGSEAFKKRNEEFPNFEVKPKWLKGKKYGSTWRFSEGGKAYSYMDNGVIIDAATGLKIADWKIEGSTLFFGASKLQIKRLSPVFFDYDAMGIPVKMDYIGEANADGTFTRK